MKRFSPFAPLVLRWSLAFVALYFGVSEIVAPSDWIGFVPSFIGHGSLALGLVLVHGIVLSACGAALVIDFHPRIAAGVLALILLEIVIGFLAGSGFSGVVVRDIGLFGMALGIALYEAAEAR